MSPTEREISCPAAVFNSEDHKFMIGLRNE